MDGTEVSPEALAGKTGHLKMEVTYTNTSKTTKTVNGKKTDIYSPFVMVTGMILSTDNFSNVTVDNGKVISDGSRNVVVGFGMPGMKESLDMSSDIADEVNIPEGFTVEADVTDCEMNSTFTVALTDIFKDIDLNIFVRDLLQLFFQLVNFLTAFTNDNTRTCCTNRNCHQFQCTFNNNS